MSSYYKTYRWLDGVPYGCGLRERDPYKEGDCYRILSDPYRKRIALERYNAGMFVDVVYDSAFLDFRHLKSAAHNGWHKEVISESEESMKCLIRNQDDRIVFIETYQFSGKLCHCCEIHSPQGWFLAKQKIFYTVLNDAWNGVLLIDQLEKPVMLKKYVFDEETGTFTDLLEEVWSVEL